MRQAFVDRMPVPSGSRSHHIIEYAFVLSATPTARLLAPAKVGSALFMVRVTVGTCGDVAAAEGEVPGGDAEPDRCGDGAGDSGVHVDRLFQGCGVDVGAGGRWPGPATPRWRRDGAGHAARQAAGAGSRPYAAWRLRSRRRGRGSGAGSPGVSERSVRPSRTPTAGRRWGRKCRDRTVPGQIRSLPRRSSRTCKACPGEHDHMLPARRKERRVRPPAVTGE